MANPLLSSFTNALAQRTRPVAPTKRGGPAPAPPALPVQPLDPAIAWDWPDLGLNQISFQQWGFCDTEPASSDSGQAFVSGTGSFSDAYRTFLALIDTAQFVPASMLTSARDAAAVPVGPPGPGVPPPGFILVPNSGAVMQIKPEWQISMTPTQWAIDQSSVFEFDASAVPGFVSGTPALAALDARRRNATLAANHPARVQVYPGAWYSDSIVRLAASGPFVGARPARQVVGPDGILRCRITEFLVASELVAAATFDDADAQALRSEVASAPRARIGAVAAADATLRTSPVAGGTRVTTTTSPGLPFIVAVSVQAVAP